MFLEWSVLDVFNRRKEALAWHMTRKAVGSAKNCMVTSILFEYFLLVMLHCTNGHRMGSHGMFGSDVSWAVQVPPLILP